jgi:hypothetical protein
MSCPKSSLTLAHIYIYIYGGGCHVTGLWVDPMAPTGFGPFIHHVGAYHTAILVFLIVDVILLSAGTTLTVMQALQVGFFTTYLPTYWFSHTSITLHMIAKTSRLPYPLPHCMDLYSFWEATEEFWRQVYFLCEEIIWYLI